MNVQNSNYKIINNRTNCYLNSVLQIFLNTNIKDKIFSKIVFKDSNVIDPINFLGMLSDTMNIHKQNDAQEAFIKIIDKLPELKEYFIGKYNIKLKCLVCNTSRRTTEDFLTIDIYTENITNSILEFLKKEEFNLECDKCKSICKTSKKYSFNTLPNILILYNIFKLNLNITNGLIINNDNYRLIGIIKHFGERNFGHYTYFNFTNNLEYNDTIISKHESINNENSYLIIYNKFF